MGEPQRVATRTRRPVVPLKQEQPMFDPDGVPTDGTVPAARKAPQKKRRAASKLPDDGSAVFLGWEGTAHKPTLGFKSGPAHVPASQAVSYAGDGHLLTVAPTGAGKGVGAIIPALLTYP